MRMDCGSKSGALRSSTFFFIQAAHSRASQRSWRRFRKARSLSEPVNPRSSPFVAGSTTRQASSFSNRSRRAANAKRENAGEARESDDGGARVWRSSSITRSLPVFLISFMRSPAEIYRSDARSIALFFHRLVAPSLFRFDGDVFL